MFCARHPCRGWGYKNADNIKIPALMSGWLQEKIFVGTTYHMSQEGEKCRMLVSALPSVLFFFLSFCHFLGHSRCMWRFPGKGSNRSCSHRPTPQPQQRRIWAASATYTTALGNAGSLTHWARPGIEPATSWFLVGFVSAAPRWELPNYVSITERQKRVSYFSYFFQLQIG